MKIDKDTVIEQAKILIVDDQSVNVRLVNKVLQQAGFQNIRSTTDSSQVVEIQAEYDADLLLLDLRMSPPDGFEIMHQLKENPDVPVPAILVITAQIDRESRIRALQSGADDFLNKPFDQDEFTARVQNLAALHMFKRRLDTYNQQLEQLVELRTREVRDTRLEIVNRLSRAAEHRDNETGMHIQRMSRIAVLISDQLGYSEPERELLLNAMPMHDVGKIGVPDHILLKPGPLDDQEWAIMRRHTTIGGEILGGHPSQLLQLAQEIALTHHERWDGKGYPGGLSGDDIPLSGRVAAVADVFDAVTSERPYKRAWTCDEARAMIVENRDAQFDPIVVDAFLARYDEIVALKTRYADPPQ